MSKNQQRRMLEINIRPALGLIIQEDPTDGPQNPDNIEWSQKLECDKLCALPKS